MTGINGSAITPEVLVVILTVTTALHCSFALWVDWQIIKDKIAGRVVSDGS